MYLNGMDKIKFSVITPCFNSKKTIERTLQSVLNQTYLNYEYIIIDGGSTDGTLEIIEKYKEQFEDKMTVVSEADQGIYDAMNKGIMRATGDLIGIVNSDDFYEKTALEDIVKSYSEKNEYQILYGMMRVIDLKMRELSILFYNHINMDMQIINHPATFVTAKLYKDLGGYSLKYKSASDYDFMLRMIRNNEVTFTPVYKIITNFTLGGMSGSYIGVQETNDVRFKYGLVSTKNYWLTKIKNTLKHILKV